MVLVRYRSALLMYIEARQPSQNDDAAVVAAYAKFELVQSTSASAGGVVTVGSIVSVARLDDTLITHPTAAKTIFITTELQKVELCI